ncbi:MAG: hypothetical protein K2H96_05390 [Muribaculaceae bacterium]|nr:hypothetical protein [Muribaculaceae bacterium]
MKKFLGIEPRNFCGSSEAPATKPLSSAEAAGSRHGAQRSGLHFNF